MPRRDKQKKEWLEEQPTTEPGDTSLRHRLPLQLWLYLCRVSGTDLFRVNFKQMSK